MARLGSHILFFILVLCFGGIQKIGGRKYKQNHLSQTSTLKKLHFTDCFILDCSEESNNCPNQDCYCDTDAYVCKSVTETVPCRVINCDEDSDDCPPDYCECDHSAGTCKDLLPLPSEPLLEPPSDPTYCRIEPCVEEDDDCPDDCFCDDSVGRCMFFYDLRNL